MARTTLIRFVLLAGGAAAGLALFSADRAIRLDGDGNAAWRDALLGASDRVVAAFGAVDGRPEGAGDALGDAAGTPASPPARPEDFAALAAAPEEAALMLADRVSAACGPADGGVAVIGDTVAIRFYETGSVPGEAGGPARDIAFERLDLATQAQVGPDGTASLPMIGRMALAGRGLGCIEARLAQAAHEAAGFAGTVTAAFAARPGILVAGAVVRPGTYAFDPSMTVGRVLAQAGVTAGTATTPLELAALGDRRAELAVVAAGLTLTRARSEALLAGEGTLTLTSRERAEVRGAVGTAPIADEEALAAASTEEMAAQARLAATRSADLATRIGRQEASLAAARAEEAVMVEGRDRLERLLASGSVTSHRHDAAAKEVLVVRRVVMQREDALAAAEEEAEQVARAHELSQLAARRELLRAARDARIEGRRVAVQISGLDRQIDAAAGVAPADHRTVIERPGPDGAEMLEAAMETRLRPGDLVRVLAAERMAGIEAEADAGADAGTDAEAARLLASSE